MENPRTKRRRWGILGTASIAETFVRAARESETSEVVAVASRDPGRARAWADRFGLPRSFGSYDDLLGCGEVEAVYVPLPNSLHAEWTLRALERGLPVLCEKPFAVTAAEARRVAAAADAHGTHVAEGFMYRHHPQWDLVRRWIREGAIGRLSTLNSVFSFFLDDPAAIPASADLAGGALMDVGCYCVHFSRWILESEPVRVTALERRTGVDETLMGVMEFPGGRLAQFETSLVNFERHRAEIVGTEGTIRIESPWVTADRSVRLFLERPGREPEAATIPPANAYALQLDDFVRVCRKEREPTFPIQDAIRNMAVIDALFESAREGRSVTLS